MPPDDVGESTLDVPDDQRWAFERSSQQWGTVDGKVTIDRGCERTMPNEILDRWRVTVRDESDNGRLHAAGIYVETFHTMGFRECIRVCHEVIGSSLSVGLAHTRYRLLYAPWELERSCNQKLQHQWKCVYNPRLTLEPNTHEYLERYPLQARRAIRQSHPWGDTYYPTRQAALDALISAHEIAGAH